MNKKTLKIERKSSNFLYGCCHILWVWVNYGKLRKLVSFQLVRGGYVSDTGRMPHMSAAMTALWEQERDTILHKLDWCGEREIELTV